MYIFNKNIKLYLYKACSTALETVLHYLNLSNCSKFHVKAYPWTAIGQVLARFNGRKTLSYYSCNRLYIRPKISLILDLLYRFFDGFPT